ncbi:MAG: excinuclease ABC subunit UvrC [Candidatus Daviesbacteria bacterium]|nr:excinuclease ABC subunit UvrC [Candidatus Daviesbacteria bacterium]
MIPQFIDKKLLPHKSGVYIYRDAQKRILYVGKALDLYHRVASYFAKSDLAPRTAEMVSRIVSLETIIVESELEALILEANLIKKFKPIYNIRLTDDKDYLYIKVTKEAYPKVVTARKADLKDALKFFGPFPSSTTVRSTLKRLRRVFPWCSNPNGKRPCFHYHIKLCPGPCAGQISQTDYKKIIKRFIVFMSGQKEKLLHDLTKEMVQKAKSAQFEEAGRIKKTIEGILYLTQSNRTQIYLENPNFLEDQTNKGLEELQKVLKLKSIPERIEGYDISNIQGHEAVASMVVLTHGEIDKSQYRKFKMLVSGEPNDYAMHQETIRRRMKHPEWPAPDLLLIDGGKGQVSSVYAQVQATGPDNFKSIPIIGLAKRMEWIYTTDGNEIRLSKTSLALKMLQKLRDESHRFAITYHRKLHATSLYNRSL